MSPYPRLLLRMCGAGLVLILAASLLLSGEAPRTEMESIVKATYLFKFLSFVEYPATKSTSQGGRSICVLGQDSFGSTLDAVARTQKVDGNPAQIRRIRAAAQAEECHILFLSAVDRRDVRGVISQLEARPVLTVSERPSFLDEGGMVLLFLDGGRLQFEINGDAARRAGLRISAKLMQLSRSAR